MAKIGYIYKAEEDDTYGECMEWMRQYGCCRIVEESPESEKQRVQWHMLIDMLSHGDELVVAKFSNAVRKTSELTSLMVFCRTSMIRLISIRDRIDTAGKLWPETSAADVMRMLALLPAEALAMRKQGDHVSMLKKVSFFKKAKMLSKSNREQQIVNMYNSGYSIDDIWETSGYLSRSSVFRILNKYGVTLNRGKFSGPLGPRKKKEGKEEEDE